MLKIKLLLEKQETQLKEKHLLMQDQSFFIDII